MCSLPRIGAVFLLLGAVWTHAGEFWPRPFSVAGLPSGSRQLWSATPSSHGWILAASDGVVHQSRGAWNVWRPASGGAVRVALPLESGGWVVAGEGFCSLVSEEGEERVLLSEGSFHSGAVVGSVALVVSSRAAYAINSAGVIATRRFAAERVDVFAKAIEGRLVLFELGEESQVFEYGSFRPGGAELSWAGRRGINTVFHLPDGGLLVGSREDLLLVRDGRAVTLLTEQWPTLVRFGVVGAALAGDTIVVATFYEGLTGYSLEGVERWRLEPAKLRGNVYFLNQLPDGFLIGTSSSLLVLPDPARFEFGELPDGELHFVTHSSQGVLIGSTAGVLDLAGGVTAFARGTTGLLETPRGFVARQFGRIVLPDGQVVRLTDRGSPVLQPIGENVATLQDERLVVVSFDGAIAQVDLPDPINSLAAVADGLLAGSTNGALRLSAEARVVQRFGRGLTRVRGVGSTAIAVDSAGAVFDEEGREWGVLPFAHLVDAVEWEGALCVLGRFGNGEFVVGKVQRDPFRWRPLDLPLSASPQFLARAEERLVVVSAGEVMRVARADEVPAPDAHVRVVAARDGRDMGRGGVALQASEDAVDVLLPPPRLGPWAVPSYTVSLGGMNVQEAQAGQWVRLPRLPWGRSTIAVRAAVAGLESSAVVEVERLRPWWARPPAFIFYAMSFVGLVLGIARWRTSRLARRARELERIVDERTIELQKAQRAREEFFSTLSHEIRNPLNGVVGLCDILDEAPAGNVAPRERMLVRTLKGCAGQLRSMLDDVLDFSRIDRGEIQLHEEDFELTSAMEGAARSIDATLSRCTLELPAPMWLRGDCGKFRQILTNLISNALKYGVPPTARIVGSASTDEEGQVRLRISVFNTGATLPEEELARIFEGFVRGEDALRRRIPGSGLGLAVSRRMAAAMGGSLTASSKEGLTEFRLEAAFGVGEPPLEQEAATVPKVSRCLAIEDEPYNRLVLGHILSQLGYEVDWAVDGASALERVRAETYDLLLTDYLLPDINGVELARRILAEVPEPKPPVIAVTAYSTPEKMQEAREAGIQGFVTKPVSRKKLEAAILGLGAQYQSRRSLDVARSNVDCDFTPLLRLQDGRRVLAEYAAALPEAWASAVTWLEREPEEAARAVHAFRSRLLAVKATVAAEQLGVLESAVRAGARGDVSRLVDIVGAMVDEIATTARARAMEMHDDV